MDVTQIFSLDARVAVVTGGTGVLGSVMARGLAAAGARVGVLGRRRNRADSVATEIVAAGGEAVAVPADVLDKNDLESARDALLERWGRIDILINAAGGNVAAATVREDGGFFDLPEEALRQVIDLNLMGSLLPCQVFGREMARQKEGCVVNVSSMSAQRALTQVVGYGAAKAGVEQLTRWLAVELARRYGENLRVNAIAPGFFLGEQNRSLLVNADDSLTERGRAIIRHTPAGRFGEPDDLIGTLIWLCGPASRFVNGAVIPVDGGFGAFSGV